MSEPALNVHYHSAQTQTEKKTKGNVKVQYKVTRQRIITEVGGYGGREDTTGG